MKIPVEAIKELRDKTLASIADCRQALHDAGGDMKKAQELLRKRGLEIAAKKQDRAAREGRVEAYVHMGNKIGVLLEVDCETDFVARNSDFCQFTKDVAMQIAACDPPYLKKEDIPQEVLAQEKNQEEFYQHACLMEQPFIKDPTITIKDYLASLIGKMGEKILIRRFVRYKIGQ
jgi:elongation factor Ts